MGLIALIISVVVDAIWPLHGRARLGSADPQADFMSSDAAADPGGEVPYDPLADPLADEASDGAPLGTRAGAATGGPQPSARVVSVPHPLWRYASQLVDWFAPRDDTAAYAGRRTLSVPGWLAVVGIPVLLIAVAQALADAIAGLLVFALHVAVLYLAVGLGAFHRRFSELRLLVGAGEDDSARAVLAAWPGADGGRTAVDPARPLAGLAMARSLLCAYRDVFAPLFWYAVLPGATGPVLYLFARFAACLSQPFAQTAYYWLDWVPLRLAALVFALVGQFEDTVFYLKAVSGIRPARDAAADPYLHQRLLLLPVASGSLGLHLTDEEVDAQLRVQAPDLDLPGNEPQTASLRPVAGLLMRSGVVWVGIYLLLKLVG